MFTKVIIGVDHAHAPIDAIRVAQAFAPNATLVLAAVIPFGIPDDAREQAAYDRAARDEAQGVLEDARREADVPHAELRVVQDTTPATGLKHLAAEEHASLLALGASRHSAIRRIVLGDVGHGVLHGSPCPVLIAPRHLGSGSVPSARVSVAFDWSPEAAHALDLAVALAKDLPLRLELIQALDVGVIPAAWGYQTADYLDGLIEPAQQRLDELVAGLGVPARGDVIKGKAADVLPRAMADADLIVCGSRGWGPAGRLAFGSTAERLMHEARSPVLVVPRGAEGAQHTDPVTARAGTEHSASETTILAGLPNTSVAPGTRA